MWRRLTPNHFTIPWRQCVQYQRVLQDQRHHSGDHSPSRTSGVNPIDIERIILQETKISRDHLTPEIALYLITPDCRLFNEPVPSIDSSIMFKTDPFWAFYWPGGQAISRYILDNPSLITGKSVLDVGSGCGASTVAALMQKAKYVVANDIDEVAGYAAVLNSQLNDVDYTRLHICTENLTAAAPQSIKEDVILLGDVFYDEEFAAVLQPWLKSLRNAGKQILVGDPGRHSLTEDRRCDMRHAAKYELTESGCIENNGFKFVNVWELK
ncbi:electron transfer flavoprotein beta subunit lysine methyltransferase-like isoform X2 [Rhagoletis pomonella]|uniref:electron transfer flavoprotein beta subunit lysine methyltransferase-like isoform X2 n=1 Tax=Rhagoletis pomonella TaxID=28610 RepID=UPI00178278E3|nr:electron transfer flavoprotein beta subunit lysine methyltransferase-like isoform X2 [Rhagoletis pomonella]